MADWEEVKRLAADFQRIQLSTTRQKLSERNVVELVSKLIELKLIDVIYTTDGKEYLTHQELVKEMKEELIIHGGRINLVDLQQILNVDLSHIQAKVSYITSHDRKINFVLGQLIDVTYKDRLAEEINDKLVEKGLITISDLTMVYDLPAEFLTTLIQQRLGSIIKGQLDNDHDTIFTHAYIARMKARIRGALSAVIKPMPVSGIMSQFACKERLFHTILDKLIKTGRLVGSVSGGKSERAIYIPDIYTRSQNDWVDSFYKQNGYLEYSSLSRLGIPDVKAYIRKRFKDEPMIHLATCCAGQGIQDQIEATAEEALSTGGWVDVMTVMPSIFSGKDANQLLTTILKGRKGVIICCDSIVASESLVSECSEPFQGIMSEKARKEAKSNPVFLNPEGEKKGGGKGAGFDDSSSAREDKRDQRKKKAAATSKSGGGTQGREVKMKATKKKYRAGHHDSDSEDDNVAASSHTRTKPGEVQFLSMDEISKVLRSQEKLQDCPEDLVTEIATKLFRPLTRQYQEVAKSIFLESSGTGSGADRKKMHGKLQEKVAGLWTNSKLFEKGLKSFSGDTHTQLVKYLLNTLCTDITNLVLNAMATDSLMSVSDESTLTPEGRQKIISSLPPAEQTVMGKLHQSVTGKNLDDFFNYLDVVCGPEHLGVMLKKPDKKKERTLVFSHRQSLLESLKSESDPAMTLHLASVVLFQTYTRTMVHAPGRVVPDIVLFLAAHMDTEQHKTLVTLQDLVVKQMKMQGGSDAESAEILEEIQPLLPKVKDIAITTKKTAAKEEEDA